MIIYDNNTDDNNGPCSCGLSLCGAHAWCHLCWSMNYNQGKKKFMQMKIEWFRISSFNEHTSRQSRYKCAYCKNIAEQQLGVGQALRLSSLLMGTEGEGRKDGVGLYLKPQDWKP